MRSKPRVTVTRRLPDTVETRMMELFNARLNLDDTPMTQEQLARAAAESDVLIPTVTDRIDAAVITAAGPNLKLIANFGAGIDHIDVQAAHDRGITVTNTPGVLTEDTADLTMALILAVARRMGEGERLLRAGEWAGWTPTFMMGTRVWGKRLGIIGLGRIGTALARRARGFGMSIHYHNRAPVSTEQEQELEATYWESLDQMLARVDMISIHCPATPATFHLLSARRLELIQPHAFLVNTSRGNVVDEAALIRLLASGRIAGAGLDVYEKEPEVSPKLRKLDNVVLLPHLGSSTEDARVDMGAKVIVNVKTFVDGHKPPDRVLPGF